jgi:hypothetical protein
MTKKDYELIAAAINLVGYANVSNEAAQTTLNKLARLLAEQLGNDNPRFNRDKFLQACGITQ